MNRTLLLIFAVLLLALPAAAQKKMKDEGPPPVEDLLVLGAEHLLAGQETIGKSEELWEWPYEGVYRERGQIPIGYRVGGTAICAWSLLELSAEPTEAQAAALHKANRFLLAALEQPKIQPGFNGGYDVRDWGVVYALQFFLRQEQLGRTPEDLAEAIRTRIPQCISMLVTDAIPEAGGWNYSRPGGGGKPAPASPFMTAPAILTLWEAQRQGHEVDAEVLDRALIALERARGPEGGIAYTARGGRAAIPGTIGRTPATEVVLHLAGLATQEQVTVAVDQFLEHWEELEKRRAKTGTHEGDFGIAPYYFYYAHYYAALAIEVTPEEGRAERRTRFLERLFSTWDPELQFNDRVFARSSNYGTAMSMLAVLQPDLPLPVAPEATAADEQD